MPPRRPFFLALAPLLIASCQTASQWGASDDSEWASRIGTARYADVVASLGQPRTTLSSGPGETKARWAGEPITVNPQPGSIHDYSVQRTEERPIWRDMLFSSDGILLRAWTSDQRTLADSQPP